MSVVTDTVAVKLGEESVTLRELLHTLKVADKMQFLRDAVSELLILRASAKRGIRISDEDLQKAADTFRQVNGLQRTEDTHRWLQERHWTVDDFEQHVERRVLRSRLVGELASDEQVEKHFAEHRRAYDRAELSHILVADAGVAEELKMQILDEGADFAELARMHSLDERTKASGGKLSSASRSHLHPAIEGAVFSARDGDVVGPIKTEQGVHLIKVERLILGKLDADIAAAIREDLFTHWLDSEIKTARVEVPLYEMI